MASGRETAEWSRTSWEEEFGGRRATNILKKWPATWRIAVLVSFDTQADIDAARANYQTTMRADGSVNFVDQMERQYEVVAGIRRILGILDKWKVAATFPTCGMTAEWYPNSVREIHRAGHEVAVHGYSHRQMQSFKGEALAAEVAAATAAVSGAIGTKPAGWRSPVYSSTGATLDTLIEAGYAWDASYPNCDLPYWIDRGAGSILALPACLDDSNMYLLRTSSFTTHAGGNFYASPEQVFSSWRCEFDVLYEESASEPRVFTLTMHPRISGRPFRAWALDRLLGHMRRHPGVAFATCSEVADLCR